MDLNPFAKHLTSIVPSFMPRWGSQKGVFFLRMYANCTRCYWKQFTKFIATLNECTLCCSNLITFLYYEEIQHIITITWRGAGKVIHFDSMTIQSKRYHNWDGLQHNFWHPKKDVNCIMRAVNRRRWQELIMIPSTYCSSHTSLNEQWK